MAEPENSKGDYTDAVGCLAIAACIIIAICALYGCYESDQKRAQERWMIEHQTNSLPEK